jgi:hypothetical protein
MFGYQNVSGTCGCGCAGCLIAFKQWLFTVGGSPSGCADIVNSIAWVNEQTGSWATEYFGTFNTHSSTSPDSSGSSSLAGGFDISPDIESFWVTNGTLARSSVQCCTPTLYCIGYWCDGTNYDAQQSCIFSGDPVEDGSYDYELPLPAYDACADNATSCDGGDGTSAAMQYSLLSADDWADFLEDCAADPNCNASATPGDCMSGDPFFGDEP